MIEASRAAADSAVAAVGGTVELADTGLTQRGRRRRHPTPAPATLQQ